MSNGLIIYGPAAVGKSTLDLNLRDSIFSNPLTEDQFQTDGRVCFMGKTAKRGRCLMATGGAEALTDKAMLTVPQADWYVAAIPTNGRQGTKLAMSFMEGLECVTAICLYTARRDEYKRKRTKHFSGRAHSRFIGPSKVRKPPFLSWDACHIFKTEILTQAIGFGASLLGFSSVAPFRLLEDFGRR